MIINALAWLHRNGRDTGGRILQKRGQGQAVNWRWIEPAVFQSLTHRDLGQQFVAGEVVHDLPGGVVLATCLPLLNASDLYRQPQPTWVAAALMEWQPG